MNRLNNGTCVICFNEQGQVLMVNRPKNPDRFCLPGGKVEPGESLIEGIVRETAEETGVILAHDLLVQIHRDRCNGDGGDPFYDVVSYLYAMPVNSIPGGIEPALTPVFSNGEALLDASPFAAYNFDAINKAKEYLEDDHFFSPSAWKEKCLNQLSELIRNYKKSP